MKALDPTTQTYESKKRLDLYFWDEAVDEWGYDNALTNVPPKFVPNIEYVG
jgi:hypothetical protein